MGWFLTSKKKKTKKRGSTRAAAIGDASESWDPKRTLLGLKFAGVLGAVIAVALTWAWAEGGLMAYANEVHSRDVSPDDIVFSQTPDWLTPSEVNLLRAQLAEKIAPGPLEHEGLADAARWLNARPDLVKQCRQVRRTPEGSIAIDVTFRQPAAVVRLFNRHTGKDANDGFHVIDEEGYYLFGPVYLTDVDHLGLPLIVGVDSDYRPQDNKGEYRFQGNEVASALSLIKQLQDGPALGFVEMISVNNRDDRQRIQLVLTIPIRLPGSTRVSTCDVVWGLPPDHPQSGIVEAPLDQKTDALYRLLSRDDFRLGHLTEAWIYTGQVQFPQAIERR